jgi:predicted glutamine amidotransferase
LPDRHQHDIRRRVGSPGRVENVPVRHEEVMVMCRWLAYSGSSVLLADLLYGSEHSLIVQSLHARLGNEETNGDGFGIGWYDDEEAPAVFRGIEPAWNDRNLRDLSKHVRSGLVFAHVRASTHAPVQLSNCHPFRHGRWLWMHNGLIHGFVHVKRDLVLEVDPALYPEIEGSTDSEVFFFLALTFGLENDPPGAVARAVGLIEAVGERRGIPVPIEMSVATTDGQSVWAFRYASNGGRQSSLFYSTALTTLRRHYPDNPMLEGLSDEARLVVSEPLGGLEGAWNEVPASSWGVVHAGADELHRFEPVRRQ